MDQIFAGRSRAALLAAISTLGIAALGPAAGAQAPRWTLTDFPRHPGEVKPLPLEEKEECDLESCVRLTVGHTLEEVYKFYQQRLPPSNVTRVAEEQDPLTKARALGEVDNRYSDAREALKPGQATPVFVTLFTTRYSSGYLPPEMQQGFKKGRAPFAPGTWLGQVHCRWAYKSPAGDLTEASLRLAPWLPAGAGPHRTGISYGLTRQSAKDMAAASEATGPREPAQKELGLPLYPGARFTGGGSSPDDPVREYEYESGDAPAKVIQFYESKLGKRAITLPDNSTLPAGSSAIVLKGTPEDPKEAVAVMPGGSTGSGSAIVIRKPAK